MGVLYPGFRMFRLALAVLLCVTFASCAGTKMSVTEDPEGGRTIHKLSPLFAVAGSDVVGHYGNMAMRIDMYVSYATKDTTFYTKMMLLSPKRWTVAVGDTLSLTVDGRVLHLTCSEPETHGREETVSMQHTPYYFSGGWYETDRTTIETLAAASSVQISLHAAEGVATGMLPKEKLGEIDRFRDKYFP